MRRVMIIYRHLLGVPYGIRILKVFTQCVMPRRTNHFRSCQSVCTESFSDWTQKMNAEEITKTMSLWIIAMITSVRLPSEIIVPIAERARTTHPGIKE